MILFDVFRAWGSALTHVFSIARTQTVLQADGIRIYGGSFLPTGLFFIKRVYKDPVGKALLDQDQCELALKLKDFYYLSNLPDNTLGKLYYEFYQANLMYIEGTDFREHLVADKLRPNRPYAKQNFHKDNRVNRFFEQISYQHDLMHVIGNHPFTIEGEATVHAMIVPHVRIPAPKLIALVLSISQTWINRDLSFLKKSWSAYRQGKKADWLFPVNWTDYLDWDIDSVREKFNVKI